MAPIFFLSIRFLFCSIMCLGSNFLIEDGRAQEGDEEASLTIRQKQSMKSRNARKQKSQWKQWEPEIKEQASNQQTYTSLRRGSLPGTQSKHKQSSSATRSQERKAKDDSSLLPKGILSQGSEENLFSLIPSFMQGSKLKKKRKFSLKRNQGSSLPEQKIEEKKQSFKTKKKNKSKKREEEESPSIPQINIESIESRRVIKKQSPSEASPPPIRRKSRGTGQKNVSISTSSSSLSGREYGSVDSLTEVTVMNMLNVLLNWYREETLQHINAHHRSGLVERFPIFKDLKDFHQFDVEIFNQYTAKEYAHYYYVTKKWLGSPFHQGASAICLAYDVGIELLRKCLYDTKNQDELCSEAETWFRIIETSNLLLPERAYSIGLEYLRLGITHNFMHLSHLYQAESWFRKVERMSRGATRDLKIQANPMEYYIGLTYLQIPKKIGLEERWGGGSLESKALKKLVAFALPWLESAQKEGTVAFDQFFKLGQAGLYLLEPYSRFLPFKIHTHLLQRSTNWLIKGCFKKNIKYVQQNKNLHSLLMGEYLKLFRRQLNFVKLNSPLLKRQEKFLKKLYYFKYLDSSDLLQIGKSYIDLASLYHWSSKNVLLLLNLAEMWFERIDAPDEKLLTTLQHNISQYYFHFFSAFEMGLKARIKAFDLGDHWLELAARGSGENAFKAFQERQRLIWCQPVEGREGREVRDKIIENHLLNQFSLIKPYVIGKFYLKHNSDLALEWFEKASQVSDSKEAISAYMKLIKTYIIGSPSAENKVKSLFHDVKKYQSQFFPENDIIKETMLYWYSRTHLPEAKAHKYAYLLTQLLGKESQIIRYLKISKAAAHKIWIMARHYHRFSKIIPVPFDKAYAPLKCAIVGTGWTGLMIGLCLEKLKTEDGHPLILPEFYERNPYPNMGASSIVGRLHFGAEYLKHKRSILDCFLSSLIHAQMFPPEWATKIRSMLFLLDKKSDQHPKVGGLTLDLMDKRYKEEVVERYRDYYKILASHFPDIKNRMMGEPSKTYRLLSAQEIKELGIRGFAGALGTHEPAFNPVIMGAYLENQIHYKNLPIHCLHEVTKITANEGMGYSLLTKGKKTAHPEQLEEHYADMVVNASWENILSLDSSCLEEEEMEMYPDNFTVSVRAMAFLNTEECQVPKIQNVDGEEEETGCFAFDGSPGGMYSPLNHAFGLGYWPDQRGSWVNEFILKKGDKEAWEAMKNFREPEEKSILRGKKILSHLQKIYPFLGNATLARLEYKYLVTFDKNLAQRPQELIRVRRNGSMMTACSTKGSYSAMGGILAARSALDYLSSIGRGKNMWHEETQKFKVWVDRFYNWIAHWDLPPPNSEDIIVPPLMRFPEIEDKSLFFEFLKEYVRVREFPSGMIAEYCVEPETEVSASSWESEQNLVTREEKKRKGKKKVKDSRDSLHKRSQDK
jgi:hypothetical protein